MTNRTQLPEVRGLGEEYAKGTIVAPHSHPAHQLIHAGSGVMRVTSGGRIWVIPPGRGLWVPAGFRHGFRCLTAVSTRTVYLSGGDIDLPETCQVWRISPLLREIILRFAAGPRAADVVHLGALLISEIDQVHVLPLALAEPRDARLRRLTQAILADPAERRTLADWAIEVGASPRTLIRRFQAETGLSFRQWRRQARLIAALERLAQGEPVTRVAFAVGYDSPSAFIEMFKAQLGTTPGLYFR